MRADVPRLGADSSVSNAANFLRMRASLSTDAAGASDARSGASRPASVEVGNDQSRNIVAIRRGEHDVAHQRCAMRDHLRTQRSDADPGAGCELEIFGKTPVEDEAFCPIVRILEFQRIADFVKAFLVERSLRSAPARANSRA